MIAYASRQPPVQAGEREWVDYLVDHIHGYRRDAVINYYVTLKSKRFVILTGPHEVDKMGLAQGVAQALVGQSGIQWSCFDAHPWWSTNTGTPAHFAMVHARFNALRMSDLIEFASEGEKKGIPFFVGIKRMSRAEIEGYFYDLPRGLLWQADASMIPVRLPNNLHIIGTFDVDRKGSVALSVDVSSPYAAVVHIACDDLTTGEKERDMTWARANWQHRFVKSSIHHGKEAKAKLARILPDHLDPLAPIDKLRYHLGPTNLPAFAINDAWLYLANAFDNDDRPLFADSVAENLATAQDYILVQNVLPHILPQRDAKREVCNDVDEYFARYHPRTYAWMQHLLYAPDSRFTERRENGFFNTN
jgi:hypothetical protein